MLRQKLHCLHITQIDCIVARNAVGVHGGGKIKLVWYSFIENNCTLAVKDKVVQNGLKYSHPFVSGIKYDVSNANSHIFDGFDTPMLF